MEILLLAGAGLVLELLFGPGVIYLEHFCVYLGLQGHAHLL